LLLYGKRVAKYTHIHTKIHTKKPKIQNQKSRKQTKPQRQKDAGGGKKKRKEKSKRISGGGGKGKKIPTISFQQKLDSQKKKMGGAGFRGLEQREY